MHINKFKVLVNAFNRIERRLDNIEKHCRIESESTHDTHIPEINNDLIKDAELVVWKDASKELPDSGMEVLVCFERNDCEYTDTCIAVFDDSECDGEKYEGPWWVDGSLTHFGVVLYWAEKPVGPARS